MYFEELKVGLKLPGTKITVTEAHVVLYGSLVGDLHPMHFNELWCQENTPWKTRIAHGMLTASLACPSIVVVLGDEAATHLSEEFTFKSPVFMGDTIITEIEVIELAPKKNWGLVKMRYTTKNQRNEVVLEAVSTCGIRYKPKLE
jgi:3-hydroxybutyryl-CoA dehydratase